MKGRGQILAVTSSKGGVGKTHLAVSLSAAMAKKGARVLLIDADLGNGIISDRLGFYPRLNLVHFFSKEKTLEVYEEIVRQALKVRRETIEQAWKTSRTSSEEIWKIFQGDKIGEKGSG